ncbi:MAG TPA: DUF742 domain-containing protein [Actinophytocola sp.]|jgi:hypothetical protein|uniref:DUF742 domain-containing protein n=1 Tax=Actinophytocola sp. TaxID=1872138 RepID=UPI002F935EE7
MPEKAWGDLPGQDAGDASNRFEGDEFRARLFGGPAAKLYGDTGIPAQGAWDSKEIPAVGPENSGAAPFNDGGSWDSSADLFSDHTGSHVAPPAPQESTLVRAYFKTGGRTRPNYDLAIEALVSTSERGLDPNAAVRQEHRSICDLCMETRSVAEIAVHLKLPLGAARVLIGDMAGMGLVLIHQSGMVVGDRPSIEFMERVLSGLRRL